MRYATNDLPNLLGGQQQDGSHSARHVLAATGEVETVQATIRKAYELGLC